jgi:hypothetical protein
MMELYEMIDLANTLDQANGRVLRLLVLVLGGEEAVEIVHRVRVRGHTVRQVARDTGKNRKAIAKYLERLAVAEAAMESERLRVGINAMAGNTQS